MDNVKMSLPKTLTGFAHGRARATLTALPFVLLLCELTLSPAFANEVPIEHWRVSIKVLLNEDQTYDELAATFSEPGNWPNSANSAGNPQHRADWVAKLVRGVSEANKALDYTRPNVVRMDLIEVIELAGLGDWNVPANEELSQNPPSCDDTIIRLEEAAKAAPDQYAWRENAINVYFVHCGSDFGGQAQYPGSGEIILLTPGHGFTALMHEVGHHMGLRHTFGELAHQAPNCDGFPNHLLWRLEPDDDGMADTLADHPCWEGAAGLDALTYSTYGIDFPDATPLLQDFILDTFDNVMSYRGGTHRLTRGQMSAMRWEASTTRAASVGLHFRRTARAPSEAELNAQLRGHWVPVYRGRGWVNWLTLRDYPHGWYELQAEVDSDIATFSNLRFTTGHHTDAATAVAPALTISSPLREIGQSLTYTARLDAEGRLQLRIAGYLHDQGYPAFFEETVLLRRPSVYEMLDRLEEEPIEDGATDRCIESFITGTSCIGN